MNKYQQPYTRHKNIPLKAYVQKSFEQPGVQLPRRTKCKGKDIKRRTNKERLRTCPCGEEFAPLRSDVEGDAVEVAW